MNLFTSDLIKIQSTTILISIDNILVEENEIEFDVRCESGTYVKELVHSDEGRTNPSVAAVLESDCEVIWLDVKDIHAD